jgi:hypothetical protein
VGDMVLKGAIFKWVKGAIFKNGTLHTL